MPPMIDKRIAPQSAQRLRNRAGYTLIELLVAASIFGVLAAAGLPHIDTRRQDLNTAVTQVVGDFRWARTRAITTGVHYAVSWTSTTSYQIQRYKQDGTGAWVFDSVARTISLPAGVSVTGTLPATPQEFNTRGLVVSSAVVVYQTLKDTSSTATHKIGLWPSGQVYAET
jgi:prepilin-type N-terminal cleavage/methylation domain-containing protein